MHLRINHPSVISESIDGEVVIIALATGTYYSLRGPAARAWDGLAAGWSTDDVTTDLRATFDPVGVAEDAAVAVDVAVAAVDVAVEVDTFVATLLAEGLAVPVEVVANDAAPAPLPAPASILPWEPLVLETFTDMQELILLDPVHEVEPGRGWPMAIDPEPAVDPTV